MQFVGKINNQGERVACVLKTAKCTQNIKVASAQSSRDKSYSMHANVLNTIWKDSMYDPAIEFSSILEKFYVKPRKIA